MLAFVTDVLQSYLFMFEDGGQIIAFHGVSCGELVLVRTAY